MKSIAILYLLIFFLFFNISVHAQTIVELPQSDSGLLGGTLGYGQALDLKAFAGFNRILVLSDSISDNFGYQNEAKKIPGAFSIAERLAKAYPDKYIVQTDFNIEAGEEVHSGQHRVQRLDNRENFPFADNTFDLVILRKGMCLCCRGKPCGGFRETEEDSARFFAEVLRVLDKSNPLALAVLHGQEGADPKVTRRWLRLAGELQKSSGLSFYAGFAEAGVGFDKNDKSISARPIRLNFSGHRESEFNSLLISRRPIPLISPKIGPSGVYKCKDLLSPLKLNLSL